MDTTLFLGLFVLVGLIGIALAFFTKNKEQKIIYRHKSTGVEVGQKEFEADTISMFKHNWTAVIVPVDHKLRG